MSGAGELRLRICSSLIMAAVAAAVTWVGGIPFLLFWLGAAILIFWEWMRLASFRFSWIVLGAIYAALFFAAMFLLRNSPYGLIAILWLFGLIWASDVAAYFAGKAIGGPKLWPAVSPNKTWSGSIAGTLAGIIAGLAVLWTAGLMLHPMHILITLAVVIAAQCGDLLESAVKRHFRVKDSSQLIPGHGGVMDRCDSLVLASVVALLIGGLRAMAAPAQGLLLW